MVARVRRVTVYVEPVVKDALVAEAVRVRRPLSFVAAELLAEWASAQVVVAPVEESV